MDLSTERLLKESRELIAQARETLSAMPATKHEHPQTTTKEEKKQMSTDINGLTPQIAARLYTEGKSVIEVARQYSTTYAKVRKLLAAENVQIRNSSARLKGRPRTKASE